VIQVPMKNSDGQSLLFHLKRHRLCVSDMMKSIFKGLKADDGENEWKKILLLHSLNIPTMIPVAFGSIRFHGFPWKSVTLTEHLYDTQRLEEYIPERFSGSLDAAQLSLKRRILTSLSSLARHFHGSGLNHNDFYLGHFFIHPETIQIYVIDLQRIQRRKQIRYRDRVKDLAQLYYSSTTIQGVSWRDCIRFLKQYLGRKKFTREDRKLIHRIQAKKNRIEKHAEKVYRRRRRRAPVTHKTGAASSAALKNDRG